MSSAILIAASSVFHAMLSKRYAEGTALAENSTVDIPLPDEDSKTMALLCRIVHMQDDVPFSLEPRDIYSLALLADKYGCRGPLRVLGHGWIKEQLPGNSAQDSAYMLASAWLLQSNALIRTLSEELVWHYVTPTSQINEAGAVLPDYISSESS